MINDVANYCNIWISIKTGYDLWMWQTYDIWFLYWPHPNWNSFFF
jgi:hypothetical protein